MARWIRIAAASDCPPGKALECLAEDRIIALFNVDGLFHALDGVCPHQGGPLGKGRLEGSRVACPWHGWQFDTTTGRHCTAPSVGQPTFAVRVEDGEVWVDLEGHNR